MMIRREDAQFEFGAGGGVGHLSFGCGLENSI
jgi:hypothetical protein